MKSCTVGRMRPAVRPGGTGSLEGRAVGVGRAYDVCPDGIGETNANMSRANFPCQWGNGRPWRVA